MTKFFQSHTVGTAHGPPTSLAAPDIILTTEGHSKSSFLSAVSSFFLFFFSSVFIPSYSYIVGRLEIMHSSKVICLLIIERYG